MIVTANNRIVGDEYPHHVSSEYLDGFRARRIEELLASAEEHDLDGFARIQIDVRSIPGRVVRRRLARLLPPGQRELRAVERLRSWNGEMEPQSVAASIYQAFILRLARSSPELRSAIATWPSATSTAPTTGSRPTARRRGGRPICSTSGRRGTRL